MSGAQRALKIISIVLIVLAVITLGFGLFLALGSFMPGIADETFSYQGETVNMQLMAIVMGVTVIIMGLVDLIIAIFGLRGANHPEKIGPFFVLCIIGVVISLIGLGGSLVQGQVDGASIGSLVVIVVCLILASKIRQQNRMQ